MLRLGFLDLVYEKLISLIVGSYYVSLYENNIVKSVSQDIAETRKNIGQLDFAKNCFTMAFLVENAELGKIVQPIENVAFDKLKAKPLGCPSNILFWNDQQKLVSSRIEKMEHTLLIGDYGTGDLLYFFKIVIRSNVRTIIFHRQDPDPGGCSQDTVREEGHPGGVHLCAG